MLFYRPQDRASAMHHGEALLIQRSRLLPQGLLSATVLLSTPLKLDVHEKQATSLQQERTCCPPLLPRSQSRPGELDKALPLGAQGQRRDLFLPPPHGYCPPLPVPPCGRG